MHTCGKSSPGIFNFRGLAVPPVVVIWGVLAIVVAIVLHRTVATSGGRALAGLEDIEAGARTFREHIEERTPLKRIATPDEVAAPIRFLLSAEASFITGAHLTVDGGMVM